MKKIFTVLIYDHRRDVYEIPGKAHSGQYSDWWIYMADPLRDGLTPPESSDRWKPYSPSIERLSWEINIKQRVS